MIDILRSYDFLVVASGTVILAIVSALIGCFSVYKRQSLVGDAVGHATYAGIIASFMVFMTRDPLLLMIGAMIAGALAYGLIQLLNRFSPIGLDAILASVLTGFFGLGMVLKTYIQGHPVYAQVSQAGLRTYIFGSAAFMMKEDVRLIAVCGIVTLLLLYLFFKELVVSVFDRDFAKSIGIRQSVVDGLLLVIMITFIALGLKSVGAVLISSLLIIPCVAANQHSERLSGILLIASAVGGGSAFAGTYISTVVRGISTGPMIILCMGCIALLSMAFGRFGLLRKIRRNRSL